MQINAEPNNLLGKNSQNKMQPIVPPIAFRNSESE
jgi:hypothetical protein